MPELCRFLGIVIAMFYKDHAPAHFHAKYGEFEITVAIDTGIVIGEFPKRAQRLVLEWYELHKMELKNDWESARQGKPLKAISPFGVMMIRIEKARYVSDYKLWLRFSDGAEGEVDLQNQLDGEVFEPLKDTKTFKNFILNSDLHTVTWPNGADFAPEFLRSLTH